jgi:hypothetical protein
MKYLSYLCSTKLKSKDELRMKKNPFVTNMVFRHHYEACSEEQRVKLRNEIMHRSGIGYTTFYYKLNHGTFRPLELGLISEIMYSPEYAV